MNEESLIHYIKGDKISDQELIEILDWIELSKENLAKYNELKNLWVISGLDRAEADYSQKATKKAIHISRFSVAHSIWRYAAIFIFAFLFGAGSLYYLNRIHSNQLSEVYNEIQVPKGEKSSITLYDGTKVWLNSGTTLKYPVVFSNNLRKVYLVGEAYFDVAKNKNQPFIVNADKIDIEVLGTRFDVCAYPGDKEYLVTLEEGSVHARSVKNNSQVILSPGEQGVFSIKTNTITRTQVNTALYSSWKENLLHLEDAELGEVIKKMERWYGIDIEIDKSFDPQEKYNLTIKTESLREMLKLLSKTTPMEYEIYEDKVMITRP